MPVIIRRRARLVAGLFSLALSSFAHAAELPSDGVYADHIDWGVIMDLSGPASGTQTLWVSGFQDRVRAVNEAGGINGRTIRVVTEDDRFDPSLDRVVFEKLTDQTPVLGISGMSNAGGEAVLNARIRGGKVPIVGTYVMSRLLTTPPTPMFYGGYCGFKEMADVGVGLMAEQLKLSAPKVATVYLDTAGGKEYADYVKDAVARMGGTSEAIPIKLNAVDATPQVLEIVKNKPDFIAINGITTTAILVLRAMDQYGVTTPAFGITYLGTPVVYNSVPPKAGSQYSFVSCFTPGDGASDVPAVKRMAEVAARYGHGGIVNDVNYVAGWVIGQLVTDAVRAAGPDISREKLVALLNGGFSIDTQGVSAPLSYTADNHQGPLELKPFGYDYATKRFRAQGEYDDSKRFLQR